MNCKVILPAIAGILFLGVLGHYEAEAQLDGDEIIVSDYFTLLPVLTPIDSNFADVYDPFPIGAVVEQEEFGRAIAMLGTDRIIIGAPDDDLGAFETGVVYFFNINTRERLVIEDPNPEYAGFDSNGFGTSVAALGDYGVIVGDPGDDAVYLFDAFTGNQLIPPITDPLGTGGSTDIGRTVASFDNVIIVGDPTHSFGVIAFY